MDGSLIHTQIYYGTYEIVLEEVEDLDGTAQCTVPHVLPIMYCLSCTAHQVPLPSKGMRVCKPLANHSAIRLTFHPPTPCPPSLPAHRLVADLPLE